MHILDELAARGLVADVTDRDALKKLLGDGPVTLTRATTRRAPSLHVGNLVPVIMQARLQRAGHKPIVVVGGATGMVGDPSGKSAERNLLGDDELAANLAGIRSQLSRFLDFGPGPTGAVLVNNADWTRGVGYLEFLRDVGKYLTINYMMAKDSVRARLEGDTGISYTEFSYMLLQAFDFVHLARAHGCRLQVGGSDQYGNITAGCELSRKMGGPQLFGLTAPLLLDSSGQKMGKTSTGERVWLDAERTSPYAFYQYFFNVTDEEAPRLLQDCSRSARSPRSTSCRGSTTQTASQRSRNASSRARHDDLGARRRGDDARRGGEPHHVRRQPRRRPGAHARALTKVVPVVEIDTNRARERHRARRAAEPHRRRVEERGAPARCNKAAPTSTTSASRTASARSAPPTSSTPTLLVVRGGRKDYRLVRARISRASK